jgi:hypothetical protein
MFHHELLSQRNDNSQWIYKTYITDENDSRKFKYLTVYLLNEWISTNDLV